MSALAGYAVLVLVFGDAVAQATPGQRVRLEVEIMPLMEDLQEKGITKAREVQLLKRITNAMISIMGDEWKISEETNKWVRNLLQ